MRFVVSPVLAVGLALCLAACSSDESEASADAAAEAGTERADAPAERRAKASTAAQPRVPLIERSTGLKLEKVLAGTHRSAEARARDAYRHPAQTLAFFGLRRNMTVVEITPGEGWYTDIIAPTVAAMGHYVPAIWDETIPGQPDYRADLNALLLDKLQADADLYAKPKPVRFDPARPVFGPPASADMVVSFRNAHNWIEEGTAPAYFEAVAMVLKPGGVFGLTDHRAPAGAPTDGKRGYVTEAQVIALAQAAGLQLADRSEINANPKDTKDHPDGVWTLPPTLALGETDRERYVAIGESDRMTLRFIKR